MRIDTYQCPNCGSTLSFDADSAKVSCDYCHSAFQPEEIISYHNEQSAHTHQHRHADAVPAVSEATANTHGYHCDNCGAEVVTDESTSSSFCYYCHSPVIFSERVSGDFSPDYIVPFNIGKEQAKQKFLKWASQFKLLPRNFTSPEHLEKITGIYVPYWMAQASAKVDIAGTGETSSVRSTSSKRYTTINTYAFERQGTIDIKDVKTLASDKVDRQLIYTVESDTEGKLKPFSTAYLSGFFSQRYNIDKQAVMPETNSRIHGYIDQLVLEQTRGYSNVRYKRNERNINIDQWHYLLMPVWILTYQYQRKTYVYALNGETGEFFGELPMDKYRFIKRLALGFVGTAATLLLGGQFLW